jgi:hypothetical protein
MCTTYIEGALAYEQSQGPDRSSQNYNECFMLGTLLQQDCQGKQQDKNSGDCTIYSPPLFTAICCAPKSDGCTPFF